VSERETVLRALADRLIAAPGEHPLRVGIDGPCGAGKTTFARELVGVLAERGADAVHLDSDGFHHQRAVRYRQGRESARGYYEDAYDFDALAERALRPLGPGGTLRYATQVHDMASDALVTDAWAVAAAEAIMVFDGTFLQRGGLRELWDEVIYLDVTRASALARGAARDAAALGGHDAATAAHDRRYLAACDLYQAEERPLDRASILIDHDDPLAPRILRW
jgi:uridine kinase